MPNDKLGDRGYVTDTSANQPSANALLISPDDKAVIARSRVGHVSYSVWISMEIGCVHRGTPLDIFLGNETYVRFNLGSDEAATRNHGGR